MKRKLHLIIALGLALLVSSSLYASTYTSAAITIPIELPGNDLVTCNATATQPDWDTILDDLSTSNKTAGEVPTGDIFQLYPDTSYSGDLVAKLYLTNTGALSKAYSYLNVKAYLNGSVESGQTPNYTLLTLQNGEAALNIEEITGTTGSWTQSTQSDFNGGTKNQVETDTSPGDVLLDIFSDNVTDSYDNELLIDASANVTINDGGDSQVKLDTTGGSGATETLRPDGAGDETLIDLQNPASGSHWEKVDEAVSDGDGTYVHTKWFDWQEDLYSTADSAVGSGVINYIRVYALAKADIVNKQVTNLIIHIKTNGVEYNGAPNQVSTTETYSTYSEQWNTNPQTSSAWTWSEIDALQIGVGIRAPKSQKYTYVTQVYVEVNYTDYSYYDSGTVDSENLLTGETVVSIDSFDYYVSAIPSGTSLQVQYSQDASNWYDSAGTPGAYDTLSQGINSIDLSGLSWSGANFYYHMLFTSDGGDTPILDEIAMLFSYLKIL